MRLILTAPAPVFSGRLQRGRKKNKFHSPSFLPGTRAAARTPFQASDSKGVPNLTCTKYENCHEVTVHKAVVYCRIRESTKIYDAGSCQIYKKFK